MATTFNSVTLPFPRGQTNPVERIIKETGYPGVDGLDWMDLGKRGRTFVIRGLCPSGYGTKSALDALNDGATHTLIVNGTSYSNVLCLGFWFSEYTDLNGNGFTYTGQFKQMEE